MIVLKPNKSCRFRKANRSLCYKDKTWFVVTRGDPVKNFLQVFGLACMVPLASAQTAPIRQGSFEVGGFMGASYGVSEGAVMGGGNVSYAVTKMFLPYVEYSYFPSIEHTLNGTVGGTTNAFSASFPATASDFHVGVHLRFPIRESRVAPYAVFGVGSFSIGSGTISSLTYTDANGSHTITGLAIPAGGSSVAVNFGGGLRYYVTPRYGIRVEVKGYKPFNSAQQTGLGPVTFNNAFLKAEAGFFIQFR
jgi:hypothetical protein